MSNQAPRNTTPRFPPCEFLNGSRDARGLLEIINFICLQSTERTFPGVVTAVGPVRIRPNGFWEEANAAAASINIARSARARTFPHCHRAIFEKRTPPPTTATASETT